MRIQLSSGQGPAECELAVGLLYEALKREYPDIKLIDFVQGKRKGGFTSIRFDTSRELRGLEGSVLWICKSPYRPEHKRKNWYVDISVIEEEKRITEEKERDKMTPTSRMAKRKLRCKKNMFRGYKCARWKERKPCIKKY